MPNELVQVAVGENRPPVSSTPQTKLQPGLQIQGGWHQKMGGDWNGWFIDVDLVHVDESCHESFWIQIFPDRKLGCQHLDWQHFGLLKHWGYSCLFGLGVCTYLEPDHKISWKFLVLSLPFKKATCPNMFSNIHFVHFMQLLGWCQISVYSSNSFHHHICLFKDFYGSNLFLNQGNQPINWRFSQSRPVTSRVLTDRFPRYKKVNWNQRSLLWRCRAASDRCGEKIVAPMTDHCNGREMDRNVCWRWIRTHPW